jgi:triosephosphate isomerase
MRKPLVAGNWKMNFTVPEGVAVARTLRASLERYGRSVDLVVLPPAVMLWEVAGALKGSVISVGAQNASWADEGAFTGEISPKMLAGWCPYLLIGHSERRHVFGETDEQINRKLKAGLRHRLNLILAVGETLEEYDGGRTDEVINRQMEAGLDGITADVWELFSVAYEPVWAIGTGRAATPEYANAVMAKIRQKLDGFFSGKAERMRILYGGSVTPANAASLMGQPEIDGALVGGASLKPDQFTAIVAAAVPPAA